MLPVHSCQHHRTQVPPTCTHASWSFKIEENDKMWKQTWPVQEMHLKVYNSHLLHIHTRISFLQSLLEMSTVVTDTSFWTFSSATHSYTSIQGYSLPRNANRLYQHPFVNSSRQQLHAYAGTVGSPSYIKNLTTISSRITDNITQANSVWADLGVNRYLHYLQIYQVDK